MGGIPPGVPHAHARWKSIARLRERRQEIAKESRCTDRKLGHAGFHGLVNRICYSENRLAMRLRSDAYVLLSLPGYLSRARLFVMTRTSKSS
jgi:hypothetical protein